MRFPEDVTHVSLRAASPTSEEECEYVPRIYFEAKIDFNDVRSGFRESRALYEVVEIEDIGGDLLWTRDMVHTVDPMRVEPGMPQRSRVRGLPAFVDAGYLSRMTSLYFAYLMRYYEVKLYRNSSLNVYSHPGESREDFLARCVELLDDPFRRGLHELHQVFVRKIEQLRERHLKEMETVDNGLEATRRVSQWRSGIHDSSAKIADLFSQADLKLGAKERMTGPPSGPGPDPELGCTLESLENEAEHVISSLLSDYAGKANAIDEYIIHPSFKDIHLIQSYILWSPAELRP